MKWDYEDATDTARRANPDSVREARAHIQDSLRQARAHIADSARTARLHFSDSVKEVREHRSDSLNALRRYRESRHYRDSVTRSRNNKLNALKEARKEHMDSLNNARKEVAEKMAATRKARTDSIKAIQKHRTDSLTAIRKYKNSRRYTDNVSVVRHERMDSIKHVQDSVRLRMAKIRKHTLDSAKTSRLHIMDSVKTVRTKYLDSIKLVRKKRTDSLARVKAEKERLVKAKEKKKEDALKLKLELKMKQKHEAWSNKQMLKKRWSPTRRFLQNSFTHYNYYYNANKKMDEAQVNMQRTRKENYDSLIGLYPFDPNRDSSMIAADMDSIVHKVSVGIQIHDPRVKWSNDLYLLLGEAYYYKGSYENASISFRYIISKDEEKKKEQAKKNGTYNSRSKEAPSIMEDNEKSGFLKHKSVHNEAILWLARTYTEGHQADNAESILSLLESDTKLPDDLKGRLAAEKAFAYLEEKNYPLALPQLEVMEDDNNLPDWLRMRAAFIHGQLLQRDAQYAAAAKSFEKVLNYYPKLEMDFYARKYIGYNNLMAGSDIADVMRPLKHVLNDGKYINYYDQVYYELGMLAIKANRPDDAINYLTKSTTTPKASRKQKATSFAELGNVYYASSNYPAAKNAYDSATKYSSSSKDPDVLTAIQRSKGLEEISGPLKVIHDQDSLLELAKLTHKEQLSAVRRYIRHLEEEQQDSIDAAENTAVVSAAPAEQNSDQSNNSASNWYFSSQSLVQQGSLDFKRKWGNRALTDNWRRSAALASAGGGNNADEDEDNMVASGNNGIPTEEYLMSKIPNTQQQKELSVKVEQRAYMLLAKAYLKLENYDKTIHTLDTLDARYPNNTMKEESLHLRYVVAIKQNKLDLAQKYAQEMLAKYPNSQYADAMRPKHSESKGLPASGKTVAAYYNETYDLLQQHQFTEVLMHVDVANHDYDDPVYKKRFEIVEAMANTGMGNYNKADTILSKFIHAHPTDTLSQWAREIQKYVKEVRNGGKPSWYYDSIPVEKKPIVRAVPKSAPQPESANNTKTVVNDIPAMYSYHTDSAHDCIIILPGIDSRTAALKKAVADLAGKYPDFNLAILLDLYNIDQGVLVVGKFPNADKAKDFMNDLLSSSALHNYQPNETKVMTISTANYRKMFSDKKPEPYYSFYTTNYK